MTRTWQYTRHWQSLMKSLWKGGVKGQPAAPAVVNIDLDGLLSFFSDHLLTFITHSLSVPAKVSEQTVPTIRWEKMRALQKKLVIQKSPTAEQKVFFFFCKLDDDRITASGEKCNIGGDSSQRETERHSEWDRIRENHYAHFAVCESPCRPTYWWHL